jgi:spore germination protein YaaH
MNMVWLLFPILLSQPAANSPGIHEVEWRQHQHIVFTIESPDSVIPREERKRELSKTVYGYYPYWMGTVYNDLQYDLLSHIAYFSVELYGNGTLGSIPNLSILENLRNIAHSHGVYVVITTTQFDDATIEGLLLSTAARTTAVNNLVNLALTHSLDGVSIDFEFPTNTVKDSLTRFMAELTDSFHTHIAASHVSIATPAVDWGNGFDYDQIALHSDGLFIMAYNYYWSGSAYAGPVSPLPSSSLWGTYSVMWTVKDYIQHGIYTEKFILGCPYYGLRWPTQDGNLHSATRGTGSALTYTRAADSAAVHGKIWEDTSKTVWYKNYISGDGWYQGWFDDSLSLRLKYGVVIDSSLGGAGIWALGYDGTKTELWGALRDAFYYTGIEEYSSNRNALALFPNPATGTVYLQYPWQEHEEQMSIDIFDVAGRWVHQIAVPAPCATPTLIIWNGKDSKGNHLPSGTYFYFLRTTMRTSAGSILFLH